MSQQPEKRTSLYDYTVEEEQLKMELEGIEDADPETAQSLIDVQMASDAKLVRMMRIVENKQFFAAVCMAEFEKEKSIFDAQKEIVGRRKADAEIALNDVEGIEKLIVQHLEMKGFTGGDKKEKAVEHYRLRLRACPMKLDISPNPPIQQWQDDWFVVKYQSDQRAMKEYIKRTGKEIPGVTPIYRNRLVINTEKGANGDED